MKRAVSIRLGISSRDKKVQVNLKVQQITVERIGTSGDIENAKQLIKKIR